MNRSIVRVFVRTLTAAAVISLAACGSSDVGAAKLKVLKTNTSRDSVLAIMGTGPLAGTGVDTLRMAHGFRRQAFMVAGAQYEVLWYRDTPGTLDDPILKERETPLVIEDNKLKGVGWSFYDKLAQEKNLPNPSLSKQRLDSIVQSQQPKKP